MKKIIYKSTNEGEGGVISLRIPIFLGFIQIKIISHLTLFDMNQIVSRTYVPMGHKVTYVCDGVFKVSLFISDCSY